MFLHEFGRLVTDIEMDIVEAVALDLVVIGAGHDISRSKLHPLGVVFFHVAFAGGGIEQSPAFAAHGFCNEEVLDLEIIEAGRVELHHFHV